MKVNKDRKTHLKPFILHVRAAENVVNVVSGHVLQELTHLLLPLKSPHSSSYYRLVCNIT